MWLAMFNRSDQERRWFVLKRPRGDTHEKGHIEVTVTSAAELHVHRAGGTVWGGQAGGTVWGGQQVCDQACRPCNDGDVTVTAQ